MSLSRLYARAVRNLAELDLHVPRGLVFVLGPNGAGKTAFLEAIYLAARGRSFRARETREVVAIGSPQLEVAGWFDGPQSHHTRITRAVAGERTLALDGSPVADAAVLAREIPLLVVGQDDARAVRTSAQYRRNLLDSHLFHVEPGFASLWRHYRLALRQRNAALRSGLAASPWDASLTALGEQLDALRTEHVAALEPLAQAAARACALERELTLVYRRGWPRELSLRNALRERGERDRRAGYTTAGPHRADLELRFGELARPAQASAGQYKAAILALRLAQLRLRAGSGTIVLLDDLAAEPDAARADAILRALVASAAQVVVADPQRALAARTLHPASMFHVEHGRVTPMDSLHD